MAFSFGPGEVNFTMAPEPELRLTNEQKLGMIVSVIKDKMDSQQLKHAVREIKLILES